MAADVDSWKVMRAFQVFISHFAHEAKIAEALQNFLRDAFPTLNVFRSSDAQSIGTGQGQYAVILQALRTADVMVVLLSSESTGRQWLAFETGFGFGKGFSKREDDPHVFPLLVRGAEPSDVRSPFSEMQVRPITSVEIERV